MIQFGGQYTFDQFKDAQVAASGLRRPFRWMLLPILAVFLLGFLVPAIKEGMTPQALFVPLVALAAGGGVYVLNRRARRRSFESNQVMRSPLSGTADEGGLALKSEYADTKTPWSVYPQATVSPRMILLYQSTSQALFIPRGFFTSEDDWNRFVALVQANVKAPPLARRRNVLVLLLWVIIFLAVVVLWNSFGH